MADEWVSEIPTLRETNLDGKDSLKLVRRGKVRDIYEKKGRSVLYLVATDRISAFDRVLPRNIPDKGRLLTAISAWSFTAMKDIVPNHFMGMPDPNVMVVRRVNQRYPIEIVVRGFIAGSLWKRYAKGERACYGYQLPDGLKENQELPSPIVTPTTKADTGHDIPIDNDDKVVYHISSHMGMSQAEARKNWLELKELAIAAYMTGDRFARANGGRLVDTKYEAGVRRNRNIIIDEVHTPDSSRYVDQKEYDELFAAGKPQRWLDKQVTRDYFEKVAKWTGDGPIPEYPEAIIAATAKVYKDCHRYVTGREIKPLSEPISEERILKNLKGW